MLKRVEEFDFSKEKLSNINNLDKCCQMSWLKWDIHTEWRTWLPYLYLYVCINLYKYIFKLTTRGQYKFNCNSV